MSEHASRQNTSFPSGTGQAHGYLALPPSGSGPAVIVIQEWWGLTDHIASVADRLAAEGFVALAPDLFGGKVAHDADEAGRLLTELPLDRAARDLAGAVDFLLGHDAVTSDKVGAIGFCMGGGFVLMLAAQQGERIGAAVPFYGVGPGVPSTYTGVRAPVQGHYAEQDDYFNPEAVAGLKKQLDAGGVEHELFIYPGVDHAFFNDNRPEVHDPDAAALAWTRTLDFFRAQIG